MRIIRNHQKELYRVFSPYSVWTAISDTLPCDHSESEDEETAYPCRWRRSVRDMAWARFDKELFCLCLWSLDARFTPLSRSIDLPLTVSLLLRPTAYWGLQLFFCLIGCFRVSGALCFSFLYSLSAICCFALLLPFAAGLCCFAHLPCAFFCLSCVLPLTFLFFWFVFPPCNLMSADRSSGDGQMDKMRKANKNRGW